MCQPLEQPHEGPYRVIKHISDNVFLIDYKGKETTISTERLKPAYTEESEKFEPQTLLARTGIVYSPFQVE